MNDTDGPRLPTVERLLDVRTPAELAFAPDGSRVAFALHHTVADVGSFTPSDLYLIDGDGPPKPLTSGAWSDRTPVWSPDGSRLAFLSDRITPGHQLPYTMIPGDEPSLVGTFAGSAESLAWSSDGGRLLVLVADPGCYGLDWSARAVTGAGPAPDPAITRPGEARRRLFMIDLSSGDVAEVGPPGTDVWEFDWDGDDRRRDRVRRPSGWIGMVRRRRGPARPRGAVGANALRADVADRVAVARRPTDARRGDGGIRERPRAAERQRDDGRPGRRNDHRPVARPGDGRHRELDRRRLALVRAVRRDRHGVRTDVAGRPA